jgi:hypothetical protein
LTTVLNDKPLLNEPGITQTHKDFDTYNELLEYKNIEISILKYLEKTNLNYMFHCFYKNMVDHFIKNYQVICEKIKKPSKRIQISIYTIALYHLDYSHLLHLLEMVYNEKRIIAS